MSLSLITGLSELAPTYDALICDVWGVIHDGQRAHDQACAALAHFRRERGPVILLTNAPRMPDEVAIQCAGFGVPSGCYDAIVSSGGAARDAVARRAEAYAGNSPLPLYYIGPERDLGMIGGLKVARTGVDAAELVLCVGLVDDMAHTPDDYADTLARMRARELPMLCANPDLQVHRGDRLLWCAGALAAAYESLGGAVIYYGKPHLPVYEAALAAATEAARAAGRPGPRRPLAIGDGLFTDIRGANAAGLEALFIADGVHGGEIGAYDGVHLAGLLARHRVTARAAARALRW